MAKRADTSATAIAVVFLVRNLEALLLILLRSFWRLWLAAPWAYASLFEDRRVGFAAGVLSRAARLTRNASLFRKPYSWLGGTYLKSAESQVSR